MEILIEDIQYEGAHNPIVFSFDDSDEQAREFFPETDEGYDDDEARLLVLYAGMPAPSEWN